MDDVLCERAVLRQIRRGDPVPLVPPEIVAERRPGRAALGTLQTRKRLPRGRGRGGDIFKSRSPTPATPNLRPGWFDANEPHPFHCTSWAQMPCKWAESEMKAIKRDRRKP